MNALGLCDGGARTGLTEIIGRSLGSGFDFVPEDGIYEIGSVVYADCGEWSGEPYSLRR